MQVENQHLVARKMHKLVWALIGVFALIVATYPNAMAKVSQNEKFSGFHVKSWTIEGKSEN